jgi:FAD/FMN-containing dehydrogenase
MDIQQFVEGVDGEVIRHGDEKFAEVAERCLHRSVPDLVVQPRSAQGVSQTITFAVAAGLEVGVLCGGHGSVPASDKPGVLIDLAQLQSIEVLDGDLVRVGGGALWGHVADALEPHGLVISSGDHRPVGVGGLTLGGGVGWMVRTWGLTIDVLQEAEVVTASGEVVVASETSNPDLFWAIRGGGGNFGVVTSFTYQAKALPHVISGTITLEGVDLPTLLKSWRDIMRNAPEELNSTIMAIPPMEPGAEPSFQVIVVWAGADEGQAAAAVAPLLELEGRTQGEIGPVAYKEVLAAGEHPPEGMGFIANNAFAREFTDECIDAFAKVWSDIAPSMLMVRSVSGAFNRIGSDATAFSCRDGEVLLLLSAIRFGDIADDEHARVQDAWAGLRPFVQRSYSNFLYDIDEDSTQALYPLVTMQRLRAIKTQYDPMNVFCLNRNIVPA